MSFDIFKTLFSNIWSIFLVIAFFGGSIFVHELGHFIAARRRGLKVERFSIGFGPKIFGWKKDGIDYRISLLPLGGYVALPQLADMRAIEGDSKDKDELPPISYADKVIVSIMGAVFNLIFAFLLASVLWVLGQPASPVERTTVVGFVEPVLYTEPEQSIPGPAHLAGIQAGDEIMKVDGVPVSGFGKIRKQVIMGTGRNDEGIAETVLTIKREDKVFDATLNPALVLTNPRSKDYMRAIGISPAMTPIIIDQVMESSPADQAHIKKGDQLLSANGQPLYSLLGLSHIIAENPNKSVVLELKDADKNIYQTSLTAENVPYTRPIVKLSLINDVGERTASIDIIPQKEDIYSPQLANPSTPAVLSILDINDPDGLLPDMEIGAQVTKVDYKPLTSLANFIELIDPNHRLSSTATLTLKSDLEDSQVFLAGSLQAELIPPKSQPMIGIEIASEDVLVHINPIAQFEENIVMTFQTLKSLLSPSSDIHVQHMMGPPGIVKTLHTFTTTNIRLVLWFVIVLNINLAILNLLPIPVLDGGHIMFATIGKLRGKDLPIKLIATTQSVFMLCLFSLMLYVSFFDVRRWQGDNEMQHEYTKARSLVIERSFSR